MSWLILPPGSVRAFIAHPRERAWIVSSLPDEVEQPHADSGILGCLLPVAPDARVLALWSAERTTPIPLAGVPLIAIWSASDASTIWSLPPEARPEALERVCQLAERVWGNHPFPELWRPKKVENVQSVFAGDRSLLDLRIAYGVRNRDSLSVLDIGTLFVARRQQKHVDVPPIPFAVLDALPAVAEAPAFRTSFQSPLTSEEDRDLRIEMPGESRHLFSMRYPEWMGDEGPLTTQQRRVISHKIKRPLRIHGPAGSGKTLVLVLKCLKLLRDAQDQGEQCHIMLVLHSTEMRSTVRTAIEAIDDRAFLAATRDDPQFLDVETLHGWCIRELGLEQGPQYVLEQDPSASRALQREILEEALDTAIQKEYKQFRAIVSDDLAAWVEGNRDRLVRAVQWELAIRIKGRGFRDRDAYVNDPLKSFVGRGENKYDRQFLFRVYSLYEERFQRQEMLDTDDVVLSMAARLTTSLWDRQRRHLGYDYVMVDETHLFNENERRVLPLLCRDTSTLLPVIMTFDEAQSIGGRRSLSLDDVGIQNTEKRTLTFVHRSCPAIFSFARDLVERGPLVFSEFDTAEPVSAMPAKESRKCDRPQLRYGRGEAGVIREVITSALELRAHFPRVAIISFEASFVPQLIGLLDGQSATVYHVKERGELLGAVPKPGIYVMVPETCGGLEFDTVIVVGADEGRVPLPIGELSREGYLYLVEDAYSELYTAVTRAKYRLIFVCDGTRGVSSILREALSSGLIEENTSVGA